MDGEGAQLLQSIRYAALHIQRAEYSHDPWVPSLARLSAHALSQTHVNRTLGPFRVCTCTHTSSTLVACWAGGDAAAAVQQPIGSPGAIVGSSKPDAPCQPCQHGD
jgi:hypothetical protein